MAEIGTIAGMFGIASAGAKLSMVVLPPQISRSLIRKYRRIASSLKIQSILGKARTNV